MLKTNASNLKTWRCQNSSRLIRDSLTTYTFDSGEAKHLFCKICGIKSFYVPRSHPDGYSVNARCLDESNIRSISITPFDGKNWEENIDALRRGKI